MSLRDNRWKRLFLFCLGISIGAAFCMKWVETEFWFKEEKFTMTGLEISYSKEKVMAIIAGIDSHTKSVLGDQLYFDFAFMAGVYPGIAALCMIAKEKLLSPGFRKCIFILALLQTLAWIADINENLYLLKWIKLPVIENDFGLYHFFVYTKWIIALTGFFISVFVLLLKRKIKMRKTLFLI
jgi:hypothetical protein